MKPQPPELPIARTTDLITIRQIEGREVFTYADIAAGLHVTEATARKAYSRNADGWKPEETGVCHLVTASGTQEVRTFTRRGVMRFCRSIKSGLSDQLFDHLLDMEEAVASGQLSPTIALSEVDKLAMTLGVVLPGFRNELAAVGARVDQAAERLAAVEEHQRVVDPREIETRMFQVKQVARLVVEGTKGHPKPWTYQRYWEAVGKHVKVSSFTNRAALTVPIMDAAVSFARQLAFECGVTPPSLFDVEAV